MMIEGVTGEKSHFSFRRPDVDFVVELDGGENDVVVIDGRHIGS